MVMVNNLITIMIVMYTHMRPLGTAGRQQQLQDYSQSILSVQFTHDYKPLLVDALTNN
jgi:hypothetical protein